LADSDVIAVLAHELLDLRSLLDALPSPRRAWIPAPQVPMSAPGYTWDKLSALLNHLTERLGLPAIELWGGKSRRGISIFESILGQRLVPLLERDFQQELGLYAAWLDAAVDSARQQSFEGNFPLREVAAADGTCLRTYASRVQRESAVLLVLPCGMPAPLLKPWMSFWSREHFVMTWESRCLFGVQLPFDISEGSVERQIEDLFCVMDSYGIERAHVMGSCGGATIALAAAALRPERIPSLGLWHGAFELGSDAAKTEHERNLGALLKMAAQDRASAAAVRSLLCQRSATSVPADVAQLVLYPFAHDELMYRYAVMNGGLLAKDVRPLLPSVLQPTLVVTSQSDMTTHPEESYRVAERLPRARLHVEPDGDHLSHFRADTGATELAASFLRSLSEPSKYSGASNDER